jgi:hypothetical protein
VVEEGGCEFSFQRPVFEVLPKHLSQLHEPNKRSKGVVVKEGFEFSMGKTKDLPSASKPSSGNIGHEIGEISPGSDATKRVDGGNKLQASPPRANASPDDIFKIKRQKMNEGDYIKFDGAWTKPSYTEKPFKKAKSEGCMYEVVYAVIGDLCLFTRHERSSKAPNTPDGLVHNVENLNAWDTSKMTTNVMPQSTFDYKWGYRNNGPGSEVIEGRN